MHVPQHVPGVKRAKEKGPNGVCVKSFRGHRKAVSTKIVLAVCSKCRVAQLYKVYVDQLHYPYLLNSEETPEFVISGGKFIHQPCRKYKKGDCKNGKQES